VIGDAQSPAATQVLIALQTPDLDEASTFGGKRLHQGALSTEWSMNAHPTAWYAVENRPVRFTNLPHSRVVNGLTWMKL